MQNTQSNMQNVLPEIYNMQFTLSLNQAQCAEHGKICYEYAEFAKIAQYAQYANFAKKYTKEHAN